MNKKEKKVILIGHSLSITSSKPNCFTKNKAFSKLLEILERNPYIFQEWDTLPGYFHPNQNWVEVFIPKGLIYPTFGFNFLEPYNKKDADLLLPEELRKFLFHSFRRGDLVCMIKNFLIRTRQVYSKEDIDKIFSKAVISQSHILNPEFSYEQRKRVHYKGKTSELFFEEY